MIESPANAEKENIETDAADSPEPFNLLNVKMLQPKRVGYERPFVPDAPPEGSTLGANWRRNNMIGQYLNSLNGQDFGEKDDDYNYVDHIPLDYFDKYGPLYASTDNAEHAKALTAQIRAEENDAAIMANAPWRSFMSAMLVGVVDPTVLLPGGAIYKNTKLAANAMKSAASVGLASAGAAIVNESFAHYTQKTRTIDESAFDVLGSAFVGSVIGGAAGAYFGRAIGQSLKGEVVGNLASDNPIGPTMTLEQSLSAQKSRNPEYQKEENSLYGGTPTAAVGKFLGRVTAFLTPQGRLLHSEFPTARAVANEMFEHNLIINAQKTRTRKEITPEGKEVKVEVPATERGVAIESEIKALKGNMYKVLMDYQDIFYKQAGISGPIKGIREKFAHQGLKLGDFEKSVWRSVVTGKESENAAVKEAANLITKKLFDPVRDEYIRLGIFPKDIEVKTAASYFMRVYNKEKLRDPAQRAKTKDKFMAYIKKGQDELKAIEPQIKKLQDELKALREQKKSSKPKTEGYIQSQKRIKELKEQLKELVPDRLWTSKGKIRSIIHEDYYGIEADKIIDNILGMGDERKLNPITRNLSGKRPNPLKQRQFLIDDIEIEDELITSFSEVAPMFISATAPNIALHRYAKRIGATTKESGKGLRFVQLEEDYNAAVAKNPEKQKSLYKQYLKAEKDIKDSFDILEGIYGNGPNTLDSQAANVIKNVSKWNYTRLMGLVQLQALTDVGSIGIKHGLFRTIYNGFIPVMKALRHADLATEDLKDLGFVCNTIQGNRMKAMMDQDPNAGQTGMFTRGLDFVSNAYGNLTLMNQWTDAMEFIAGKMSMARTLRAIDRFMTTGNISEKEMNRIINLGIGKGEFETIHQQWRKHGGKSQGSYWVNWGKWDSDDKTLKALGLFKLAVQREIDQTVISGPGLGEKPKYARTGIGSLLFQFKGFSYAMTNNVLISGLQRGDAEFYQGLVMMSAMAMLSYGATSLARGEEIDLDYDVLFRETIDRSGITGVFGNVYNLGNKLGLIPGKAVSRYKTRGLFSTLGGPSVGIIEDNLALLSKLLHSDEVNMTENDMYKFLRNLPAQNYVFMHRLNKMVAKDFADRLGWEESPE